MRKPRQPAISFLRNIPMRHVPTHQHSEAFSPASFRNCASSGFSPVQPSAPPKPGEIAFTLRPPNQYASHCWGYARLLTYMTWHDFARVYPWVARPLGPDLETCPEPLIRFPLSLSPRRFPRHLQQWLDSDWRFATQDSGLGFSCFVCFGPIGGTGG